MRTTNTINSSAKYFYHSVVKNSAVWKRSLENVWFAHYSKDSAPMDYNPSALMEWNPPMNPWNTALVSRTLVCLHTSTLNYLQAAASSTYPQLYRQPLPPSSKPPQPSPYQFSPLPLNIQTQVWGRKWLTRLKFILRQSSTREVEWTRSIRLKFILRQSFPQKVKWTIEMSKWLILIWRKVGRDWA